MTTPSYDYAAGRNDGWSHAQNVQTNGAPQGSADSVPGGQQYLQGFSDGVELSNSGFNADGTRQNG